LYDTHKFYGKADDMKVLTERHLTELVLMPENVVWKTSDEILAWFLFFPK
jgi:hypothetical protein